MKLEPGPSQVELKPTLDQQQPRSSTELVLVLLLIFVTDGDTFLQSGMCVFRYVSHMNSRENSFGF